MKMETQTVAASPAPVASLLDELISEEDFCVAAGISVRTARNWHAQRRGPRRTLVGRRIYYRRSAICEWLERCEEQPKSSHRRRSAR